MSVDLYRSSVGGHSLRTSETFTVKHIKHDYLAQTTQSLPPVVSIGRIPVATIASLRNIAGVDQVNVEYGIIKFPISHLPGATSGLFFYSVVCENYPAIEGKTRLRELRQIPNTLLQCTRGNGEMPLLPTALVYRSSPGDIDVVSDQNMKTCISEIPPLSMISLSKGLRISIERPTR